MCVSLLPAIVHLDVPYPPKAIKLILNCLIHDSILIRKIAIKLTVFVLKQRKQSHKKVDIETTTLNGISSDATSRNCIPGNNSNNIITFSFLFQFYDLNVFNFRIQI